MPHKLCVIEDFPKSCLLLTGGALCRVVEKDLYLCPEYKAELEARLDTPLSSLKLPIVFLRGAFLGVTIRIWSWRIVNIYLLTNFSPRTRPGCCAWTRPGSFGRWWPASGTRRPWPGGRSARAAAARGELWLAEAGHVTPVLTSDWSRWRPCGSCGGGGVTTNIWHGAVRLRCTHCSNTSPGLVRCTSCWYDGIMESSCK